MYIKTEIFGKKVRKPGDIVDDVEFERYALDFVENKANDYIEEYGIKKEDIQNYKIKLRRTFENLRKQVKGGDSIVEKVEFIFARIYLSFWVNDVEG